MTPLEPDAQGPSPGQNGCMPVPATAGAELTTALRAALLDPALWRERLGEFARATDLAVALTDEQGRLLGEYILPQSSWSRSTSPRSTAIDECPFSPATLQPCSCVRDALNGSRVVVRDGPGLIHFAVALSLGHRPLGVLLAGQVSDRPPERGPRRRTAARLGLSLDGVPQSDRQGHPVKQATLQVYAELLGTLGQMILESNYHAFREAGRLEEMTRLRNRAMTEIAEQRRVEAMVVENAGLYRASRKPTAARMNSWRCWATSCAARSPPSTVRSSSSAPGSRTIPNSNGPRQWSSIRSSRSPGWWMTCSTSPGSARVRSTSRRSESTWRMWWRGAVESSRPLIDARKVHLRISLPEQAAEVEGDLLRLVQVVSNLLINGAKYTGEGGRIELAVEADGDQAILRVRDTGVGIAGAMLPRVFEMFTQVPGQVDRSEGGLGIGLSLVRSLIDRHGGSVQAIARASATAASSSCGFRSSGEHPRRFPSPERSPR